MYLKLNSLKTAHLYYLTFPWVRNSVTAYLNWSLCSEPNKTEVKALPRQDCYLEALKTVLLASS